MHNYRTGDQVLLEIPAVVVRAMEGFVRVRFGDIEYDAEPTNLMMIKRSIHVGDEVVHEGREGVVAQTLEDDVFLVRFPGAAGAEAYRVAGVKELEHSDGNGARGEHQEPLELTHELPAAAPESSAPVAAVEPGPAATTPTAGPSAETQEEAPAVEEPSRAPAGISEMASSLSGLLGRTGQRRQPIDLESLGTTETVRDVRESGSGEMVLGDDMRLKGGSE